MVLDSIGFGSARGLLTEIRCRCGVAPGDVRRSASRIVGQWPLTPALSPRAVRERGEGGTRDRGRVRGGWAEARQGLGPDIEGYWIASRLMKVPVRPTAFGTVMFRKKVYRPVFAA